MLEHIKNWINSQSIQKYLVCIGFICLFGLILVLNYFFPIYADDMLYSVVKFEEKVDLLHNFQEIGEFIHFYYFNWGGRVVAHFLAHILLLFGKIEQSVINSLVFCAFIFLMYKISTTIGQVRNNLLVFILILSSIFLFTPSFISSSVWKTGSANYLWMTTLLLAFVYPYFKCYNGKQYPDTILRSVLFLMFGIVAAWSNETAGPAMVLLALGYIALIHFYAKKKVPNWMLFGLIGAVIGCALMIFSPGNAVRAKMEGYPGLFTSVDLLMRRLEFVLLRYRYFMFFPLILYFLSVLFFYFSPRDGINKKNVWIQSLLFFAVSNVVLCSTIMAPAFPPRAFIGISTLTILAASILYANIEFRNIFYKIFNTVILVVLISYSAITYIDYFKGLKFLHGYMIEREAIISEAKAKGEKQVAVLAVHLDHRFEYTDFKDFYKSYYDIDVLFLELGDPRLEKK